MTRRRRPGEPRQLSLLLIAEPMRADGYCSRCNRDYVDIIRHRTSGDHRQRSYVAHGSIPNGRPGWMIAMRSDPDDQYADQNRRLQERRSGTYSLAGIGPLFGDV